MGRPRIGVFGGTFDPPHVGHLVAAVEALHRLDLDRVLLVVANHPWQKEGERPITPAEHRLAMVEAAVEGVEGLEASALEIGRGGPSFTADTLAELADKEPGADLFLILGADAAVGLPTWDRAEEVRDRAHLVVVNRPGCPLASAPEGWQATLVGMPAIDLSSTDLRHRVATGAPMTYLVPEAVARYIEDHDLYR
jgi:nicotinate-nucleotide adenylyltransferase